jgi:hypothetical protein
LSKLEEAAAVKAESCRYSELPSKRGGRKREEERERRRGRGRGGGKGKGEGRVLYQLQVILKGQQVLDQQEYHLIVSRQQLAVLDVAGEHGQYGDR